MVHTLSILSRLGLKNLRSCRGSFTSYGSPEILTWVLLLVREVHPIRVERPSLNC